MDMALRVAETLKSFRKFFDFHRLSRPADMNQATSRISYNTRYFSGNYGAIVAMLGVYAMLTNLFLLLSLVFLVGGFTAINKFAPEPTQVGDYVVTQKNLYIGLFVIGIPMLWFSGPLSTLFWVVGASGVLIIGHAAIMEPGIESEYATVQDSV